MQDAGGLPTRVDRTYGRASNNMSHLGEFSKLGGPGRDPLFYGDWTGAQAMTYGYGGAEKGNYTTKSAQCHYSYRGSQNSGYDQLMNVRFLVVGTRPRVLTTTGGPDLPTSRLLGGRALVSDAFDKASRTGYYGNPWASGAGVYHHKTSYNVVYGDYHVGSHFDNKQEIINWPGQYYFGNPPTRSTNHELSHHVNLTFSTWGGSPQTLTAARAVWHWFDQSGGIDLNHADDATFPPFP
jgi:hypothetical protein